MPRSRTAPLALAAAALLAACGGDEEGDAGQAVSLTPTFASVRSYLSASCSGCHRAGAGYPTPTGAAADLDYTLGKDALHAALVGADSFGPGAAAFPKRVVAGSTAESLLFQKLANDDAGTYGEQMPPTRTGPFDAARLEQFRAWIAAGAPND